MDLKWLTVKIEPSSVDLEARTIEGMASTKNTDEEGEAIIPGAWRESLALWKSLGSRPKFLAYHMGRLSTGHSPVIGKILKMKITPEGLAFKAWFAKTDLGEEHLHLYSTGSMDAFSAGFRPMERERDPEKIAKLAKRFKIGVRDGQTLHTITTKAHLMETSVVALGMNMEALEGAAKAGEPMAIKMLKRMDEHASLKLNEGLVTTDAEETTEPDALKNAVGEADFEVDFESVKNADPIDELGPSEETIEFDADPLEVKADEPKEEEPKPEEPEMKDILRDLVDCLKGLGASVSAVHTELKDLRKDVEKAQKSGPPVEPVASTPGATQGRDAASLALEGLHSIKPDLKKMRQSVGLE